MLILFLPTLPPQITESVCQLRSLMDYAAQHDLGPLSECAFARQSELKCYGYCVLTGLLTCQPVQTPYTALPKTSVLLRAIALALLRMAARLTPTAKQAQTTSIVLALVGRPCPPRAQVEWIRLTLALPRLAAAV